MPNAQVEVGDHLRRAGADGLLFAELVVLLDPIWGDFAEDGAREGLEFWKEEGKAGEGEDGCWRWA